MADPFRYISYVPADPVLGRDVEVGHGVEVVLGRCMIPVAAGATPEEAAHFADDLSDVLVFDSATGSFVSSSFKRAKKPRTAGAPPSPGVH